MAIRVEHGPSMVPVGRLAFRAGQNEYIKKRRSELERIAMQQSEMANQRQMQNQKIMAGFQEMQFNHQAGMQRQMMANQFQMDRDQKMHDWQLDQDVIDHERRIDLMDMGHKNSLDELRTRFELEDDQAAQAVRRAQAAKSRENLYGMLTPYGKEQHDKIGGQIAELDSALQKGEINQEQYDEAVAPLKDQQEGILNSEMDSEYKRGARYQDGYVGKENGYIIERVNGQDVYRWDAEGEDGVKYKNVAEWQEAHTKEEKDGDNIFKIIPDPFGGPPQRVQIQNAVDVAKAKNDAEKLRIEKEDKTRESEKQAANDARELYEKYTSKGLVGDAVDKVTGGTPGYRGSVPSWALGPDGEVSYDAILAHERGRYGLEVTPGSDPSAPSAANVLDGVPFDQLPRDEQLKRNAETKRKHEEIMMTTDQAAGRDPSMLQGAHPQGPNVPQVGSEARPFQDPEQGEHGDFVIRPDGNVDRIDAPVQPPTAKIPLKTMQDGSTSLGLDHTNPQVAKDLSKHMGNMIPPEMIEKMSKERMITLAKAYNNSLEELRKEPDEQAGLIAMRSEMEAAAGGDRTGQKFLDNVLRNAPEEAPAAPAEEPAPAEEAGGMEGHAGFYTRENILANFKSASRKDRKNLSQPGMVEALNELLGLDYNIEQYSVMDSEDFGELLQALRDGNPAYYKPPELEPNYPPQKK